MNELQIFENEKFGTIRTLEEDRKVLFCAKDVAAALGYSLSLIHILVKRSNTKIEHPILKKLVDQKANYLLSKPWTVDTGNQKYGEALNEIFDPTFRRKIKSLGKGAVKSGIAWIQPYFEDDGRLAFMRIPSTEIVPLWKDAEKSKLDAFIRVYDQIVYTGNRKETITHAEFWFSGGIKWFISHSPGDRFVVDREHGSDCLLYTSRCV